MTAADPAVLARIRAAIAGATNSTAAMTETVRVLKQLPGYSWVGFYLRDGDTLILGPYSGAPSPHTRIPLGRGICGAAATTGTTIVVDDVHADPRYLACSLETQSEIVVPVLRDGVAIAEIDIDSNMPAAFGQDDRALLEAVAALISETL